MNDNLITRFHGLPKIELHDHLDGGLRPDTLLELLEKQEISTPFHDKAGLFHYLDTARKGSLANYLSVFAFTVPVLQTESALFRAAFEAVEDWANDGIVYGELRFAPELHERAGLKGQKIVSAVLSGLSEGEKHTGIKARLVVCGMRNGQHVDDAAKLAVHFAGKGVVGFDIAGPERGYRSSLHRKAFKRAADAGLGVTIHAGEDDTIDAIQDALEMPGLHRIGHGTVLGQAMERSSIGAIKPGPILSRILSARIGIEVCISSNVQTGIVTDIHKHPVYALFEAGCAVCLCTDNRLVSGTSASQEMAIAATNGSWTDAQILNISKKAFELSFAEASIRNEIMHQISTKGKRWLEFQSADL